MPCIDGSSQHAGRIDIEYAPAPSMHILQVQRPPRRIPHVGAMLPGDHFGLLAATDLSAHTGSDDE